MAVRKMHFITLMCVGPTNHHNGGWRHPDSDGHRVLDPERYEEIARIFPRQSARMTSICPDTLIPIWPTAWNWS